jgi:hypothetical protein
MAVEIKEAYTWCVTLHDDTQIVEFDDDRPDGRGFSELDKSQKAQIKTLHLFRPNGLYSYVVTIPDGAEPVFFRRNPIEISLSENKEVGRTRINCIGWKQGDSACYLFVFGDGSVLMTSDFRAV